MKSQEIKEVLRVTFSEFSVNIMHIHIRMRQTIKVLRLHNLTKQRNYGKIKK